MVRAQAGTERYHSHADGTPSGTYVKNELGDRYARKEAEIWYVKVDKRMGERIIKTI